MECKPILIAIAGGSGAGKSWMADRLQRVFGASATRLSLDSFYLDRSYLPFVRRLRINFDHPRAIDWPRFESVLQDCREGRATRIPQYNFATHTRLPVDKPWTPTRLVLVDGLWLWLRPGIRALFDFLLYLDCPVQLRLERRLARDVAERGRTPDSVRDQFWKTVAPMHDRYVSSQKQWAHRVLEQPSSEAEIRGLVASLVALAREADRMVEDEASVPAQSRS